MQMKYKKRETKKGKSTEMFGLLDTEYSGEEPTIKDILFSVGEIVDRDKVKSSSFLHKFIM